VGWWDKLGHDSAAGTVAGGPNFSESAPQFSEVRFDHHSRKDLRRWRKTRVQQAACFPSEPSQFAHLRTWHSWMDCSSCGYGQDSLPMSILPSRHDSRPASEYGSFHLNPDTYAPQLFTTARNILLVYCSPNASLLRCSSRHNRCGTASPPQLPSARYDQGFTHSSILLNRVVSFIV